MHFLLVNLYGQPYTRPGALETKAVPLKLNSDINEILKKNTVAQIYEAVLSDINEAEKLINKESWEQKFSLSFHNPICKSSARPCIFVYGAMGECV